MQIKPETMVANNRQIGIVQKKDCAYFSEYEIGDQSVIVKVFYSEVPFFGKEDEYQVWLVNDCKVLKNVTKESAKRNSKELLIADKKIAMRSLKHEIVLNMPDSLLDSDGLALKRKLEKEAKK